MGNSNSPSVAEVESAPTDIPPEVVLTRPEGKEITNDELTRLRDILFGSQLTSDWVASRPSSSPRTKR
jgi:hypothetical protein